MRTWAEISLKAIEENIKNIRKITKRDAKIMAIVKADAYGHGFLEVAKVLSENGADCFGVATLDEAKKLRDAGFSQDILILSSIMEEDIKEALIYGITMTVCSYEGAKAISDISKAEAIKAKIHIKLDTGMGRIGWVVGDGDNLDVLDEIIKISKLDNLVLEGIFSHFSTSDEENQDYTRLQFKRFMSVCDGLKSKGLDIPIKHIANSAAVIMYPEYHLNMVRPGVILYGLYPSNEVDRTKILLRPAMTLKSKITYIKTLEENRGISYGKEYITKEPKKIATVPVGYADGYVRSYAGCGEMIVNGKRVKIVGRICMDQCMIDVTNVNNINIGDEVTLFGDSVVTAEDIAEKMGTINYEAVCMVGKRIPRIYIKDGKTAKSCNYLLQGQ